MEGRNKMREAKTKLNKVVGKNIREQRKLRKIATAELAEIIDLKPTHVGLIERGVRGATPATLTKLAKAFNISVDDFFAEDGHAKPVCKKCKCEQSVTHQKINAIISPFNEQELELLLPIVKWAASLRKIGYEPKLT